MIHITIVRKIGERRPTSRMVPTGLRVADRWAAASCSLYRGRRVHGRRRAESAVTGDGWPYDRAVSCANEHTRGWSSSGSSGGAYYGSS